MLLDTIVIAATAAADTSAPTPVSSNLVCVAMGGGPTTVEMEATTAADVTGPVEYSFDETSGNPGATDSGWQTSPIYTDTGLNSNTQYTYQLQTRDAVTPTPNVSSISSPASVMTPAIPATVDIDTLNVTNLEVGP